MREREREGGEEKGKFEERYYKRKGTSNRNKRDNENREKSLRKREETEDEAR